MEQIAKITGRPVQMIAHRGASAIERENSAAAFVAAGNRSYFGIETDVHITADGQTVIIHDDTTGRVAEKDLAVETVSRAELDAIRLTDPFTGTVRSDLVLPTLEEYLGICRHYGKTAVLELKNRMNPAGLATVAEILKASGYEDHTIVISFYYENLLDFKAHFPQLPMQFLTGEVDDALICRLQKDGLDLDILWTALTPEWVAACHAAGILVNCWTVDDPAAARTLAEYGVDFITSNCLE